MRQGQQNRRGRGRGNHNQGHSGSSNGSSSSSSSSSSGSSGSSSGGNNNNRKSQNLLSKNYESSGPDVKIRGTAQHVAEKYMHLARDAMSSGDLVTAENYLQHAEHYNRIIAAAQAAHAQQYPAQSYAPQPYVTDNGNGASGGGRPQPYAGHQPDVADYGADAPVAVVNGSDETPVPVMPPDAEQPIVAETDGDPQPREQQPRQRRRRRPVGGPEGRLNAAGSAVPAKAEPEDMAG